MRQERALAEGLRIGIVTKADEERLATTNRWSSKRAAPAEHDLEELCVFRRIGLHVEGQHLLAPCHDDGRGLPRQRECGRTVELVFARILLFVGDVVVLREKLPRFLAARSTAALVVPVDLLGHGPRLPR